MILKVEHIHKKFYRQVALEDVSFSVPGGTVFGLLGPNGAGKTTLIRIVTRILLADEGRIFFNGEEIKDEHIKKIGYLPEERGLYKKMEVLDEIVYLGMLKGLSRKVARERALYWMKKWDMLGWRGRKVEELSKGMQQKIQFIVSLVHEPELLILDEPFSGFDPVNAQMLKEEILSLKKQGATIVFSSHNMHNVEEICDEIVLINKSKKILEGNVWELRNSFFENMYDFEFEGNVLGFTNALWTAGEVILSERRGPHNVLRIKLAEGVDLNRLLELVLPVCRIKEVRQVLPSLHDIFVRSVSGETTIGISSVSPTE